MHTLFVFDIETVPDVAGGRRLLGLDGLSDAEVVLAMQQLRRQESGNDFMRHHLHQVVAVSVVLRSGDELKVWSLGSPDSDEADLIRRFFSGLERFRPQIVSWNGSGFDLPVLHYRALLNRVQAPLYWETGEHDSSFRYNNYTNRYHTRHLDLMDQLSGFQARAAAPLDQIATLLGYPGKMGMSGAHVWDAYQAGQISAIRDYCETDVLNTYLVYLRVQHMQGQLTDATLQEEEDRVVAMLAASGKPHLQTFLDVWRGGA
jgi:predicted PolB exonuclease-like 3'-5' exonuclease